MSEAAVDALRAEREDVLAVARSLSADEWTAASDCDGWRVQDVLSHMTMGLRQVVDPASVPAGDSPDVEQDMELGVATRKGWTTAEVLADYETISAQAIEAFVGLQREPLASTPIPMKNLGTHPMHLVPNAFAFDHYCHLHVDILKPTGPIDRVAPPADELRLAPTIEWMLAGVPQMCEEGLAKVATAPVLIEITGPGARSLMVGGDGKPAATIRSSSHDFVIWGTQRRPWRDYDVVLGGDTHLAAAVADNINVI
ncbi:MAG TPA: maleylpyruvate isomerase family mycothiol-dependent enzyme [Acidimicrobiales bacterium]|jgi:uncharacterized protein (TIGR03083 family)|nr:maleylpyruvate isomerase family mycothiol-dependent enzyme [Acidimicrobiales bacterium]